MAELRDGDADAFWSFSVTLYAKPGVADALLTLQNAHRLNVNLILFCLFAAENGQALTAEEIARLASSAGAFEGTYLAPLRRVRDGLKEDLAAAPDPLVHEFRERVKVAELAGEQALQAALVADASLVSAKDSPIEEALRMLLVYGEQAQFADEHCKAVLNRVWALWKEVR